MTPINLLLRNSFEDVEIEALTLDIDASEQARSATLERVWLDGTRVRPGSTVNIKVLLRTYRGEEITKSLPLAGAGQRPRQRVGDGGRRHPAVAVGGARAAGAAAADARRAADAAAC